VTIRAPAAATSALGGKCHDAHQPRRGAEQRIDGLQVGVTEVRAVVRAAALLGEERPLEVNAEHLGAGMERGQQVRRTPQRLDHHVQRLRDEGGCERRHPGLGQPPGDLGPLLGGRVDAVGSVIAVDLQIDQAGHEDAVRQTDVRVGGAVVRHVDDPAAVDGDPRVREDPPLPDHPGCPESGHGATPPHR
jgi:hypothetical protein